MRNVFRGTLAVALCVLSTVHVVSMATLKDGENQHRQRFDLVAHQQHQQSGRSGQQRRARSAAAEQFLTLISEIARIGAIGGGARGTSNVFLPAPIKLEGGNTTLQLVLIPVPAPTSYYPDNQVTPTVQTIFTNVYSTLSPPTNKQTVIIHNLEHNDGPPIKTVRPPSNHIVNISKTKEPKDEFPVQSQVRSQDQSPTKPTTKPPQTFVKNDVPQASTPEERPSNEKRPERNTPIFLPVEDSKQLLLLFRARVPVTPSLPPSVIEPLVVNIANDEVEEVTQAQDTSTSNIAIENSKNTENCRNICKKTSNYAEPLPTSPPLPRFERSMKIEAVLNVPSADYSEPYTLWWDAVSGSSLIEHHGGTATSYRIVRTDGRVKSIHVRLDRTGDSDVRRCTIHEPRLATHAIRSIPVLPDLSGFTFAGYIDVKPILGRDPALVERWVQAVRSSSGRRGATNGEVLTYRHELIVARAPNTLETTPLRYAVAVDSSMLGANCESYVHRFQKAYIRQYDNSTFNIVITEACDYTERTNQTELVEPLREFSLLQRDPKYDEMFSRYKRSYDRKYADDLEEAIRKNILIQSSRFVSSGNRQGSSFELDVNFQADRLKVELELLYGIGSPGISSSNGDPFPYSKKQLRLLSRRLPLTFDWRERGGVTSVRNQQPCSVCWAFSVVGAVEGALFAKTGRLVALSEQSLMDCKEQYGTPGCKQAWPKEAYNYIIDNGIPALDEYPYVAQKQQCRTSLATPVTRISSFVNVTSKDITALKVAILKNGPAVVLLDKDTSTLHSYKRGFYYDAKCNPKGTGHAMVAVGWTRHHGETYFILKNSWGTGWGENGYIYMRAKTNTCGFLRRATYPVLQSTDVLRIPSSARSAVGSIPTYD